MSSKIKLILLLIFSIFYSNAQTYKLGKVTEEELKEKKHPNDSSAVAAILFNIGKVSFIYNSTNGFEMITEVNTKIKIYKKEGLHWANKAISCYTGSNGEESVKIYDAFTYNLENGKIVKTKLKKEGEFEEKINNNWKVTKITMPNVKEGSVVEFQYIHKSRYFMNLKKWDFELTIPVNYSEFNTYIPEYFTYNTHFKGSLAPTITKDAFPKKFTGTYQEMVNSPGGYQSERGTYEIEYLENQTTYILKNIAAIKEEAFVNNIDNYTSSVTHELTKFQAKNSIPQIFATSWEAVAKDIYNNESFGEELKKTGYFEEDIQQLIAGITSREEKMVKIFELVKSKVKWNETYGLYCDDGVKSAYKNHNGNVAEINLMLTAMLQFAGFNANPILISTRSNGVSLYPSRNAYNYVIVGVEINNEIILLDATESYSTPNVLPARDLNWFGRLIKKEGASVMIDLMPKKHSAYIHSMNFTFNKDNQIIGKIRKQKSDQFALEFRKEYTNVAEDNYLEGYENRNNNIDISDYKRENAKEIYQPLIESFSFQDTHGIEKIGEKIYISPLLFLTTQENPFKQEKREYPVDFGHPMSSKNNIFIDIPEGYQVVSLPEKLIMITGDDNNIGSYKYLINQVEGKIQIAITTLINTPIVPSSHYDILKNFFQKMIDKENEKIVFEKIK